MWAGGNNIIETNDWIVNENGNKEYKLEVVDIAYPPSLYKCIDETVVNALDHHINNLKSKNPVTKIMLEYNMENGEISVENNGPGVEIEIHKKSKMYVPQMLFGTMFSGGNMNKTNESITGGTNGVGSKIANVLSKYYIVETVRINDNPSYYKYYVQKWINNMSE